jgi:RNA polymerase sigma-70 factor (ECF subfamily)
MTSRTEGTAALLTRGADRGVSRQPPTEVPAAPDVADRPDPPQHTGVDPEELTLAVRQAQRGEDEAFRALYRAVQPGLLRYLRALVGNDAEDVASEAWLQIARDLGSFHGDYDGFRGWAATIGRHRAMDHLRKQQRRPSTGLPVEYLTELPAPEDTAGRALELVASHQAIAMIATLPRDQAEAVLLRVVMGLDADSAGQVLGKRAGAVRTAAYRGLRRLAKQLDQADPAGAQAGSGGD